MHSHAVSLTTGVILSRMGRCLRRRSRALAPRPGSPSSRLRVRTLWIPRRPAASPNFDSHPQPRSAPAIRSTRGSRSPSGGPIKAMWMNRGQCPPRTRYRGQVEHPNRSREPENNHCYGSLISDPQVRTPCLGIESQVRLRPLRIVGNGRDLSGMDVQWSAQNQARESHAKPIMHKDRQCSGAAGNDAKKSQCSVAESRPRDNTRSLRRLAASLHLNQRLL